jgi:PIN domain nuclease of toxin-antitoxin system
MTLIIDTQSWIWMMNERDRFSESTLERLESGNETLYLSIASCWEAAIKHALGKLRFPEALTTYVPNQIEALGLVLLPIELAHALGVATLPRKPGHGDPFDRLIISQALALRVPVLTSDRRFAEYGVEVLAP